MGGAVTQTGRHQTAQVRLPGASSSTTTATITAAEGEVLCVSMEGWHVGQQTAHVPHASRKASRKVGALARMLALPNTGAHAPIGVDDDAAVIARGR